MITPDSSDLQELVRDLHQRRSAWLPAGLGSRLDWGAPVAPCTVVSTAALAGIREHSPGDFTLTVGAGTPLVEIQEALARHGQWLALDFPFQIDPAPSLSGDGAHGPGQGGGSIGGLVARGLAGGYRERYLGVRDQLIGLRLLRADGVEARAGGKVVKNVAGYDLMRLLCGSWGSLGLITELTLRTLPVPPERGGLLLSGPPAALVERLGRLLRSGLTPERLDLWTAPLAAAAGLEPAPVLLVALASVNRASLDAQVRSVAALAECPPQALAVRVCGRDELAVLLERTQRSQPSPGDPPHSSPSAGAAWLLRLGVLPTRLGALLERPELAGLPVNLAAGSGLGLAWAGAHLPAERVEALRRGCRELGGHLTVLRQPAPASGSSPLPAWEDAPSRALIEAIKDRFDPRRQLAPGRLPGVALPQLPVAGIGAGERRT